ncbi:MAG: DEAD/DEAH box helicase, partial [Acidimicrobiia bacterium]
MELDELVTGMADRDQLVHLERIPARPAIYRDLTRPLPPELAQRLPPEGLWSHQAEAIDLLREGRSVAIATGTASGKSLTYQVAIAEAAAPPRDASALLVFPTKALAQDQLRALGAFDAPGVVPVTYDGDTPNQERVWARRYANVLLTNPDMLHVGILP